MNTSLYVKSLIPDTPVYMWASEGTWTCAPPKTRFPKCWWLSNQAGLMVVAISAINIDNWRSLLYGLEVIHRDLVFDSEPVWKTTSYKNIHRNRWAKLSAPRPTEGDMPGEPMLIATKPGGLSYGLALGGKGYGGWYELKDVPDLSGFSHFPLWGYTVYVMKEPVELTGGDVKRMICSTFDCLYTYDADFTEAKQYLAHVMPTMKSMWEGRKACG